MDDPTPLLILLYLLLIAIGLAVPILLGRISLYTRRTSEQLVQANSLLGAMTQQLEALQRQVQAR